MRHLSIVVLLLFAGFWSFIWGSSNHLRVCGGLDELTTRAFDFHGISTQREGFLTTIELKDEEKLIQVLCQVIESYQRERTVIQSNIASTEQPLYQRRILTFADDGTVAEEKDVDVAPNWVYLPSHPSAVRGGPRAGYVPMPNINVECEKRYLEEVDKKLTFLRGLLSEIDADLIIPDEADYQALQGHDGTMRALHRAAQEMQYYCPTSYPVLKGIKGLDEVDEPQFDLQPQNRRKMEIDLVDRCQPLTQHSSYSEGPASVATALNCLYGSQLSSEDIDKAYGFQLLKALRTESRACGYNWRDAGDISEHVKRLVQTKLDSENVPVIVALNGPEFSPSGCGNIVTLVDFQGDTVTYADSSDGKLKTTQWEHLVNAPKHPDGNFVFVPEKIEWAVCALPEGQLQVPK